MFSIWAIRHKKSKHFFYRVNKENNTSGEIPRKVYPYRKWAENAMVLHSLDDRWEIVEFEIKEVVG
jgi:hypothetical protein